MAGSNQTHIWHIEDGSVSIGLDLLCRIADSLGVKVADLIDF
ncbi:transcriptional regulator with XRE-family HTH domain [Slackia isoflavoniconvertens]|nr:transcriptional regulator with XRE-family HTH domain [Slackia isoflavoniconvertens]